MYSDFFWSTGMRAIRIGDNDANAAVFGPSEQAVLDEKNELYTILDTGASYIYISALYFEDFINMFFDVHGVDSDKYEATNSTVTSECTGTGDYKSIYFLMGGQWLEVRPEDYVNFDKNANLCKFLFKGIDAPFNIVGLPLYIDYYVSHFWGQSDEGTSMSFSSNGRDIKAAP